MKKYLPSPRQWLSLFAVASVLTLGACASKGVMPVTDLANARASITQAESAGATQKAPVELLTAREKLGQAEAAVRAENFVQARRLAEAASADAELAERKARAAKAQEAAMELGRANATLERELTKGKDAK